MKHPIEKEKERLYNNIDFYKKGEDKDWGYSVLVRLENIIKH